MSTATNRPVPQRRAAFFDFDGTVIDGYSAIALLKDRARRREIGPLEAVRLTLSAVGTMTGRAELEDFLRAGVLAFQGHPMGDLEAMGERLARKVLGGSLFPEAVAAIRAHQRNGDIVVIASSALPFQVDALARELGVDHVLCTRLGEEDGICTGQVEGDVLWGKPKADAVRALAAAEGIDLDASHAYANGDEDIDFLETVGHPHAVNPGPRLEQVATARRWPVETFTAPPGSGIMAGPRTIAAYGGLAVSCGVGAALGLVNRSRRTAANISFSVGSEVALSLAGVSVDVSGAQHLWSHRPAVFIFNHQSLLDPLVVFKLLQRDVTGVGKKEIARQPGLAQFAWLINAALVDRADVTKAKEALKPALDRLSDGYSITIAPEGTRSITSRVGPFKKGAFHLAMQGGVPVVPIVIRNSGELQWRGSSVIRPGTIDVAVLPPLSSAGWTVEGLDATVREVRDLYVNALDDWESLNADGQAGATAALGSLEESPA